MPTLQHAKRLLIILAVLLSAGCAHLSQDKTPSTPAIPKDPNVRIIMGRFAEIDGDLNRALELYEGINDPFAWLSISRIKIRQNDFPAALSMIEKVIASGSHLDDALDMRMQIYVMTKKWQEAIADLEALAIRYPNNRLIRLWLARFKLHTGDYQGARSSIESIPVKEQDFTALYILAEACLGDNDKECAKNALKKAIENGTNSSAIYITLGRIYEVEGDHEAALDVYKELLEIIPGSREAYKAIIETYLSNDQHTEALSFLQELYAIEPENKDLLYKIIIIQLENKQFGDALNSLKKQGPASEMDNYYAAIANAGLKKYKEALEILDSLQPQRPALVCDVTMLKATILDDMGKKDDSIATLRAAWDKLQAGKTCPEVGYRLASALEESGKRDAGLEVAQNVLKDNPHDSMMLNFVGYIWAEEGINLPKAQSMIEEALKQRPDDGYIMDSMGWVLYKRGQLDEAVKYMEKALKQHPDDPTINIHMGDIYSKMGKSSRALEYYFKAKVNTKKIDNELEQKIKRLLKKSPKTKVPNS